MKFKSIKLYEESGQRVSRMIEQTLEDLAPGDIVIQSQYAAVNYKDARAVTGVGKVLSNLPAVPGVEVAGLVVESSMYGFLEVGLPMFQKIPILSSRWRWVWQPTRQRWLLMNCCYAVLNQNMVKFW